MNVDTQYNPAYAKPFTLAEYEAKRAHRRALKAKAVAPIIKTTNHHDGRVAARKRFIALNIKTQPTRVVKS